MNDPDRARSRGGPIANLRRAALAAGAVIVVVVVAATLVPIDDRPRIPLPVDMERAFAYMAMVCAFVVARPRRWFLILSFAIVLAGLLELAQALTVSRHGTAHDAAIKIAGCGLGAILGLMANAISGRVAGLIRKAA